MYWKILHSMLRWISRNALTHVCSRVPYCPSLHSSQSSLPLFSLCSSFSAGIVPYHSSAFYQCSQPWFEGARWFLAGHFSAARVPFNQCSKVLLAEGHSGVKHRVVPCSAVHCRAQQRVVAYSAVQVVLFSSLQ